MKCSLAVLAALAVFSVPSSSWHQAGARVPGRAGSAALDDPALSAICQPGWTPTFGSQLSAYGPVHALAVFDDGSGPALYAGGEFTSVGGVHGLPSVAANRVAKWNGSSWATLASGVNGSVRTLAVFDDGTGPALYAGGYFTNAGGQAANRIARWNGSSWSALGSGISGDFVEALAVFDDGSGGGPALYAGGLFTGAGGVSAPNIAKWNGSSWAPLGSGTSARVLSLAVFDDESGGGPALFAGGAFPVAGGVPASDIARWDGSSWSALGSGMNGRVDALAVFDDGSGGGPALFAAGNFTTAGGTAANHVARWDGSSWAPLGDGLADNVEALAVFDDGDGPALYAGSLVRWDGSSWTSGGHAYFPSLWLSGAQALCVFDDGGGDGPALFVADSVEGLIKWDGWELTPPADAPDDPVTALLVADDGSGAGQALHVAGTFDFAGNVRSPGIARWDGEWNQLGLEFPVFPHVLGSLAVFDDGASGGPALYAGNIDSSYEGPAIARVARREGSSWVPLGSGMSGPGQDYNVRALTVFDDGGGPALYAGGHFVTAGGVTVNHIARWDGASWSELAGGVSGASRQVLALTVFDDGSGAGPELIVGGDFLEAGGVPAPCIAKWNGSRWAPLGSGMDDEFVLCCIQVSALAVFDDGSGAGPALYAGGDFTIAGGTPANRIAKWDGSSWTALGSGVAGGLQETVVQALAVFDDGAGAGPALYVGGEFTTAGGVPAPCIAKWNGTSWSALGNGMTYGDISALEVFDSGDGAGPALYAGGSFTASPAGDPYIARWTGCPDADPPLISCPAPIHVDDAGPPGEIVTFAVTASDRDPHATLVCEPPAGSFFRRGTTLVRCTATDGSGNRSSCSFPVTVQSPRVRVR